MFTTVLSGIYNNTVSGIYYENITITIRLTDTRQVDWSHVKKSTKRIPSLVKLTASNPHKLLSPVNCKVGIDLTLMYIDQSAEENISDNFTQCILTNVSIQ